MKSRDSEDVSLNGAGPRNPFFVTAPIKLTTAKVRIDVDLEDYYRIRDSKKNQD